MSSSQSTITTSTNHDKDIEYYLEWRKTPSRSLLIPPIKCNTTGCLLGDDIWIFGGKGSSSQFNEIWKYSTSKLEWEYIESKGNDIPPSRDGHSMIKITNNKFIIYGGQGELLDSGVCERGTENGKVKYISMRRLYDDMYEYDCSKLQWKLLPRRKIRPLARRGHSLIYIKANIAVKGHEQATVTEENNDGTTSNNGAGYLLLFGGSCIDLSTGFEKPACDVWLYSLDTYTWEEVHCDGQIPLPVYGHCAELIDNQMVIIGGTILSLKSLRGKTCSRFACNSYHLGLMKFPKKKRVDDLSNSLASPSVEPSFNNTISLLNISTMTWTQMTIDISMASGFGLNLVGHSIALSPLNPKEIIIFGGRRSDENATSRSPIPSKYSNPPTATLLTLNLEEATLCETSLKFPKDLSNLPEARLNQLFIRRHEEMVQLKPPVLEDKSLNNGRKGKNSRRAPPLPVKRPKILPHAVLTLFGGSKLYSSGFCSGMLHEVFFIPIEKKESSWVTPPEYADRDDLISARDGDVMSHRFSTMSAASAVGGSVAPRRMSSMQMMLENQVDGDEIFHLMNIKEDSDTKIFSPKRGIGAHYFAMKTQLSRSRSTFSRSGNLVNNLPDIRGNSNSMSSPSRRPISAPSTLFHEYTRGEESKDPPTAGASTTTSDTSFQNNLNPHEKIQLYSNELCPLIKGMSVHEARHLFHKLHPSSSHGSDLSSSSVLSSSTSAPLLHTSFTSTGALSYPSSARPSSPSPVAVHHPR